TVAYVTNHGDLTDPRHEVRLWDTATGADRVLRPAAAIGAVGLRFSPDGRTLAVGYALKEASLGRPDFPVELWDVTSGRQRWRATGHHHVIASLAFSPDSRELVTGGWDHRVRFWEAASGQELRRLDAERGVDQITFSPDGKMIGVAVSSHEAA